MAALSKNPPSHPVFDQMVCQLARVTPELFAAYQIPVVRSACTSPPGATSEMTGAASIGYVGDRVRGALTLLATAATVKTWLGSIADAEFDLGDALGEFSNMLLGRLKACLHCHGFPILLATPKSLVGRGLRLSVPPGQSAWLTFDGPSWQMNLRLDATFDELFSLSDASDPERAAEAGEIVLF